MIINKHIVWWRREPKMATVIQNNSASPFLQQIKEYRATSKMVKLFIIHPPLNLGLLCLHNKILPKRCRIKLKRLCNALQDFFKQFLCPHGNTSTKNKSLQEKKPCNVKFDLPSLIQVSRFYYLTGRVLLSYSRFRYRINNIVFNI